MISIRRPGEKGAATASELSLPAEWAELSDALDRARIYDELQIYSVSVINSKRSFLFKHIPSFVNLYELNNLAERLAVLSEWESSAFEALVKMNEAGGKESIVSMERLINLTYSTGSCHHVGEITDDKALGEFVLENGLREDLLELSEESIKLLDLEKIGREHREATGGVLTFAGYFESNDNGISNQYQSKDLLNPEKPKYVFHLEIVNTNLPKENSCSKGLNLKLPSDPLVVETILKTLSDPKWEHCSCSKLDSIIPGLEDIPVELQELPQLNELAFAVRSIDDSGALPKYKAVISTLEQPELQTVLQLAKELDAFSFYPDMAGPADYADYVLDKRHDVRLGDSWYPYIDRYGYGCSAMEKDHMQRTEYGFIGRTDGGPILSNEENLEPVMELQP